MKTFSCFMLLLSVSAASVTQAAIVHVTRPPSSALFRTSNFVVGALGGGLSYLNSPTGGLAMSLDTTADTGTISSAVFPVSLLLNDMRSKTFVTPPNDFPNPPTIETFTETITFNPINPVDLAPQLLSSTTGPITYGGTYGFPTTVTVAFPASFTLSGIYKLQGPTESVIVPFTVAFNRTTSANLKLAGIGFVNVGSNFPDTATIAALVPEMSATYTPSTTTLFTGTVEGRSFSARYLEAVIFANLPIPEPTSVCLGALGMTCLSISLERKRCWAVRRKHALPGNPLVLRV